MMKKLLLLSSVFALVPCATYADAGTPLVWTSILHMLFGNGFLGVAEGMLLAMALKLPRTRCICLMIAANYFSAWLGIDLVHRFRSSHTIDLYTAQSINTKLIGLTYIFTLLLEWPFVASCLWKTRNRFIKSILANAVIQTLSYVAIFSIYWQVSERSLYTDFTIKPIGSQPLPTNVDVYLISSLDGNVYRYSSGNDVKRVFDLHSTNSCDYLCLMPSSTNSHLWDLVVMRDGRNQPNHGDIVIRELLQNPSDEMYKYFRYGGWGSAAKIGSATNSPWNIEWSHWASIGLFGKNLTNSERFRAAFGNPVNQWTVWRAIHLPEEMVLFQLGSDQLCLLDIDKKNISIWQRGYGPIAIESSSDLSENEQSNHAVVGTSPRGRVNAPHR